MQIVVISDIHATRDAFMALPETGDELWVLGDLVGDGPNPSEILALVRSRGDAIVRGNHDQAVGFGEGPQGRLRYEQMAIDTEGFTIRSIGGDLRGYLQLLRVRRTVERDGRKFYLCHAIPSNPSYEYRPADSDQWLREVNEIEADYLLVGHTHAPFIRKIGSTTVVNPGSLGQPKTGKPDACFAVWYDDHFELNSSLTHSTRP